MSYRLISKASLYIADSTGATTERIVDVRAYPAPKRAPSGSLIVDGNLVAFQRTGGKGRGTVDRQFAYFPLNGESAYVELTLDEAKALVGGSATVATIAKAAPAPAPVAEPTTEPVAPAEKALRRVRGAKSKAELPDALV
jgi:hypothetical protein